MRSRPGSTTLLYVLCATGAVVGIALTLSEAREGEPVRVANVVHHEGDGVVTVSADVANHTDVARCPDMRAAVRDRESRDLLEVRATPIAGDGSIPPGVTVRFGARIDGLTSRQLDEELADVVIYVYEPHRCAAEG